MLIMLYGMMRRRVSNLAPVTELAALERRFDGPVPVPLRDAVLAGGAMRLQEQRLRGELRGYRMLIRDTLHSLRQLRTSALDRRPDADRATYLQENLDWYRRQRRHALQRLIDLRTDMSGDVSVGRGQTARQITPP